MNLVDATNHRQPFVMVRSEVLLVFSGQTEALSKREIKRKNLVEQHEE